MFQYITVFDPTRSHGEEDLHQQLLLYHSFEGSENSLNDKLGQIGVIQGLWSLTSSLTSSMSDNAEVKEKVIELDKSVLLVIQVETRFFICLGLSEESPTPHEFYLAHLWHCYWFFALWHGQFSSIEGARELTNLLNEHFVPFWCDLQATPAAIVRKGVTGLWPESHKMAELEFLPSDQSWESLINQDILLESESFLGIKDILVYHLPRYGQGPGGKTHGLVRHFSNDLDTVSHISNWLYHSQAVYDTLSSHVLASNTHYRETPAETRENSTTSTTGETILHNLTLPISLAYDAVQEVGATTGISNSISLFMDYLPKWNSTSIATMTNGSAEVTGPASGPPYGYLISPLCGNALPENYKMRVVHSQIGTPNEKTYNCLFWYYRDATVVIVSETTFEKIWDRQYLEDLSYKLFRSMERFYATAFPPDQQCKKDPFGYALLSKHSGESRCSIPSCPFTGDKIRSTFLDLLPQDKLWELQLELVQFLQSLQNSRRDQAASEERLLRLSNGLVCFLRETPDELALVVANWFDETAHKGNTLISGLGPAATRWWLNRSQPG